MAKFLNLYCWMAFATVCNFLVIFIYTDLLGDFYTFIAFIIIAQSLATTLDFGLNSLLMRKCVQVSEIDNDVFSIMRFGEIALGFIWCLLSILFVSWKINSELMSQINPILLVISFLFIPLSRILSQFQRTFLYAANRHIVATKSLAIFSFLKLIVPLPFMVEDITINISIYLVVYTTCSVIEYVFLTAVNYKKISPKYNFIYVKIFVKTHNKTLLALAFTSIIMSLSTQIEKNVLFEIIDIMFLIQVTHMLQISSIVLIIFGPISQIIQPIIIRKNLTPNPQGLKQVFFYSFGCTICTILIVKLLEIIIINFYPMLFKVELNQQALNTYKFFSFLAIVHIQASVTYFYNIGREKLIFQAPSIAFQVALDILALTFFATSPASFIIIFSMFRLISYNLCFFLRYVGELNLTYAKIFVSNMCALLVFI